MRFSLRLLTNILDGAGLNGYRIVLMSDLNRISMVALVNVPASSIRYKTNAMRGL